MFIAHFTERPYQDPKSGYFGATGKPIKDLDLSNEIYDSQLGSDLYNRYLDEKIYAEEMGFDGLNAQRAPQHALLHGWGHEHRGRYPGPHDQAGQDCTAGQHTAHMGRPPMAGGAAFHHRHDLQGSTGFRLGARL